MNRILAVVDHPGKAVALRRQLGSAMEVAIFDTYNLGGQFHEDNVLFDVDLQNEVAFNASKDWLHRRGKKGRVIAVVNAKDGGFDRHRAALLGVSETISRPVHRRSVLNCFLGDLDPLLVSAQRLPTRTNPGICAAIGALSEIFSASRTGRGLNHPLISEAADRLDESIARNGLAHWLNLVRLHHSQTYQHSLIVAGMVAAYGARLGFSGDDRRVMTEGALLHDIGKLQIPLSILEKPAELDASEWDLMKQHPQLGYDSLMHSAEFGEVTRNMVLHHHEMLDGSGYPHGLAAGQLSDPVRIMTICDIFGALLEKRSYRPSMTCADALSVLNDMGGKLDRVLLRELSFCGNLSLAA